MTTLQQSERVYRRLRIVRWVALADFLLLLALVAAALTGQRGIVHILGPLHGINFLLLLVIAGAAAIDGIWGWWFPAAILLTAGPPGAFVGEWIIHRRIKEQSLIINDSAVSEAMVVVTEGKTGILASPLLSTEERLVDKQKEQI